MSEPAQEATHEPTQQEAMQISMAGAVAAQEANTPQQAEQRISAAVEEKARELKVTLDPTAARAVGREVISQLEQMGAFREPEPEPEVTQSEQSTQEDQKPQPKRNWIQRIVSDD